MPACELCRREVGGITTHHLIPRTQRKSKKNKQQDVTRDRVKGRPVDLCRLCHKRVHVLTHKEAEQYF